jgi:hypothetical protein
MPDKPGGRQGGAENVKAFHEWANERDRAGDWKDYVHRGQLNRSEVAKECCFALSSFRSNKGLGRALQEAEEKLERSGVFAKSKSAHSTTGRSAETNAVEVVNQRIMIAKNQADQRVKALEEQNATLRAEVFDLREQLKRLKHLDQHLCRTGRLLHQ